MQAKRYTLFQRMKTNKPFMVFYKGDNVPGCFKTLAVSKWPLEDSKQPNI